MEQHPQRNNQPVRPQGPGQKTAARHAPRHSEAKPRPASAQDRPVPANGRPVSSHSRPAAAQARPVPASNRPAAAQDRPVRQMDQLRPVNPQDFSRQSETYTQHKKKMPAGKKVLIGVLIALLVVLLGGAAAAYLYLTSVNDSLSAGVTQEEQLAIQDALAPAVSYDEPFYVMLIGSDRRAGESWLGARSDTNIVARVDTSTGTITILSIPRDTKMELPGYGIQKFNAAYAFEGTAGAIRAASNLLGVEISHYVEVNFEELIALVDLIGGVTVNVPERINDPNAGDVVIEAGEQFLDGEAALVFARSRYYYDGDFTRASNQRILIEAIAKKVLSMSVAQLPGVLSAAANSVTTDLSVVNILNVAMQFKSAPDLTIYSAMIPSYFENEEGISYSHVVVDDLREMMEIVEAGGDPNDVDTWAFVGSILDVWAEQEAAANQG